MPKVTPNPPETDPASPKENLDSPTAPTPDFQPSIADIKPTPRTLSTMFIVNPEFDIETLLGYACESLASAEVMANDLADHMTGVVAQFTAGHFAGDHAGGVDGESGIGPSGSDRGHALVR